MCCGAVAAKRRHQRGATSPGAGIIASAINWWQAVSGIVGQCSVYLKEKRRRDEGCNGLAKPAESESGGGGGETLNVAQTRQAMAWRHGVNWRLGGWRHGAKSAASGRRRRRRGTRPARDGSGGENIWRRQSAEAARRRCRAGRWAHGVCGTRQQNLKFAASSHVAAWRRRSRGVNSRGIGPATAAHRRGGESLGAARRGASLRINGAPNGGGGGARRRENMFIGIAERASASAWPRGARTGGKCGMAGAWRR